MGTPSVGEKPQGPTPPPPSGGISSGVLARRLGISPTTLRSWDKRYGLGPAARDRGRHRRWSPDDVAMIEEMCRLTATGMAPAEAARVSRERSPAPPARDTTEPVAVLPPDDERTTATGGSGLPLGPARAECRGLARAAVRLDSYAVQDQLTAFLRAYDIVTAWEEVMMPTLHAVGRKWETSGDRYVEVEHFLSWHVSTALRTAPLLLGRPAPRGGGRPVLLACTPGEQHTLPLEAVHAVLTLAGLPVRMLGAAVPADALTEAVRRTGPAAVVLWSQTRSSASNALAHHLVQSAWGPNGARQRALVQLAGPGWRGAQVEGATWPQGLRDAVTALLAAATP
ncbi:MerR family transcriptional regulator [Streptomyces sp. NPDC102406]|uniref:MerR family transcriptional regulator n=1 Tax=Streptomyces sp. NPDC102406 TaxID=3366171 RepID=UPI0037F23FB9